MRLPTFFRRSAPDLRSEGWDDEDDAVAGLLERYAQDSLSPDEPTLTRVGATVRAAFVEATAERRAGLAVGAGLEGAAEGRRLKLPWRRHRAFAAVCTIAVLTLSTVGLATAQSGPGQPFYRLRLDIESVNLPPNGSESRVDADLNRADARLAEIATEAASSDWNGAADAAAAYREVVSTIALPADAPSRGIALQRLDGQLARLEQLRASSHGPETAEVDRAIAALCRILGIPVPVPTPVTTPTPAATPVASPGSGTPSHDGPPETAEPRATTTDAGGGSEPGHSPEPSTSPNDVGPGSSGADIGPGEPGEPGGQGDSGGQGGDHPSPSPSPSPTPKPSENDARTPGPSDSPGSGH